MKKVLILGATGMAGHVVYLYLKSLGRYDIVNIVYRSKISEDSIVLDVTDQDHLREIFCREKPDYIINCIGILIHGSQEHTDNAIYINSYFPHFLERISGEIGSRLIHISTDCVFSGNRGAYKEDDFRDADDVYGRSKALGEIINERDVTIRTSIIGPELKEQGEGLFHWFMKQNGEINGYSKAYWSGVTTLELAKAIDYILGNDITGLVHLTNGREISKYELLCLFKEYWNRPTVEIKEYDGKNVNKSLCKSLKMSYQVPDYRVMLSELQSWMQSYSFLYEQYFYE